MRTRRHRLPLAATAVLLLGLSACGSDSSPVDAADAPEALPTQAATGVTTPAGTPAPSGSPVSPGIPAVLVTASVTDGKVDGPSTVDAAKGATVVITVTSDTADELHVHGYDQEVELPAGRPATVRFVADQDGSFEVETHESDLLLFTLRVR